MKKYTIWRFLLDLFLGAITGGIWWVYLLCKALFNVSHNG